MFISGMKDKKARAADRNVLHKRDEGQKGANCKFCPFGNT
ncbi:hypothetical protein B4096_0459 [Heyndrickxia coagulans]|nr:hypothetical protein B4096_0459 [Heyndrickxia coagulans]